MQFTRPEGCRAAVTPEWETTRDGYKLTARLVCGARQNTCSGSFPREIFDINTTPNSQRIELEVGQQVSETLGAMCLGCPGNTVTVEPPNKVEGSPKVREVLQFSSEEISGGLHSEMDNQAERYCSLDDHLGSLLSRVSEHFVAGTLTNEVHNALKAEYVQTSQEQADACEKLHLLYERLDIKIIHRVC